MKIRNILIWMLFTCTDIFLPYGYDEEDTETQYNIFYIMHGWIGDMGQSRQERRMKRCVVCIKNKDSRRRKLTVC